MDNDATAGSSISRSKIAEVEEWMEEGDDGLDRCGAEWWNGFRGGGMGEPAPNAPACRGMGEAIGTAGSV